MAAAKRNPEFVWGDVIKVPPRALCPDGLHPEYGAIYGVVISHRRLWRNYMGLDPYLLSLSNPAGNERIRQYLVALISERRVYPGLEIKLRTKGPFKGWYVTAGLFVHVLESQLHELPAPERYRDSLDHKDCQALQRLLRKLIEYDPDEKRAEAGIEDEEAKGPGLPRRIMACIRHLVVGSRRAENGNSAKPETTSGKL